MTREGGPKQEKIKITKQEVLGILLKPENKFKYVQLRISAYKDFIRDEFYEKHFDKKDLEDFETEMRESERTLTGLKLFASGWGILLNEAEIELIVIEKYCEEFNMQLVMGQMTLEEGIEFAKSRKYASEWEQIRILTLRDFLIKKTEQEHKNEHASLKQSVSFSLGELISLAHEIGVYSEEMMKAINVDALKIFCDKHDIEIV